MSIYVTGCRVLIKPLELEELDPVVARAKALGITFEKDERKAKTATEKGVLLQIGSKASPEYMEGAKIGDLVGFTKFGGKFVKDGEQELLIVNDEDIICVFKEKE